MLEPHAAKRYLLEYGLDQIGVRDDKKISKNAVCN